MKRIGWIVLLACCGAAAADDRGAVFGRWASKNSIVDIYASNGELKARVIALKDPLYRAGEAGPPGTARADLHNPDAALRQRPIVGMELLSDYTWNGKQWRGRIYDPESGKTYNSHMHVDDDGNLDLRGYVGMPMFGRTKVFVPVARCSGDIPEMLAKAKLPSSC